MGRLVYVTDEDGYVVVSALPGEAGGCDLWIGPEEAEDIAQMLEAAARRVRAAFLFATESSDDDE